MQNETLAPSEQSGTLTPLQSEENNSTNPQLPANAPNADTSIHLPKDGKPLAMKDSTHESDISRVKSSAPDNEQDKSSQEFQSEGWETQSSADDSMEEIKKKVKKSTKSKSLKVANNRSVKTVLDKTPAASVSIPIDSEAADDTKMVSITIESTEDKTGRLSNQTGAKASETAISIEPEVRNDAEKIAKPTTDDKESSASIQIPVPAQMSFSKPTTLDEPDVKPRNSGRDQMPAEVEDSSFRHSSRRESKRKSRKQKSAKHSFNQSLNDVLNQSHHFNHTNQLDQNMSAMSMNSSTLPLGTSSSNMNTSGFMQPNMGGNMQFNMYGNMQPNMFPNMGGYMHPNMHPNMPGNVHPNMSGYMHPTMNGNMHPTMNGNLHPTMNGSMHPNMAANMSQNMSGYMNPNMSCNMAPNMSHNTSSNMFQRGMSGPLPPIMTTRGLNTSYMDPMAASNSFLNSSTISGNHTGFPTVSRSRHLSVPGQEVLQVPNIAGTQMLDLSYMQKEREPFHAALQRSRTKSVDYVLNL